MPRSHTYPPFSLVLAAGKGRVVTLRDFGNAASRELHLHIPLIQLPPPLLPLPLATPSTPVSSGSPPSTPPSWASALPSLTASSSSNSRLSTDAVHTNLEGRLVYSVEYEDPISRAEETTFGPCSAHPAGELQDTPNHGLGLSGHLAKIFSTLYRELRKACETVTCRSVQD